MAATNFPNGVTSGGTAIVPVVTTVVNGAGTVTPTAPVSPTGGAVALTGYVATINSALGGTAVASALVVGGTISGSSIVLAVKDNGGAAASGTATIAVSAFYSVA